MMVMVMVLRVFSLVGLLCHFVEMAIERNVYVRRCK